MTGSEKSITYSSTRGCPSQKSISFRTAVMRGLAHDRGLFVPDSFPTVSPEELESWRNLSYADLATEVIGKFVKDDEVPRDVLEGIVKKSCGAFRSEDVTPLVKVEGHYVLVSIWLFADDFMSMLDSFAHLINAHLSNYVSTTIMHPSRHEKTNKQTNMT